MFVFFVFFFWFRGGVFVFDFLYCDKCLMMRWCFAMADFLFVFCFLYVQPRGVGGFWHVEIIVYQYAFLCSGLISRFLCDKSVFSVQVTDCG